MLIATERQRRKHVFFVNSIAKSANVFRIHQDKASTSTRLRRGEEDLGLLGTKFRKNCPIAGHPDYSRDGPEPALSYPAPIIIGVEPYSDSGTILARENWQRLP